MLAKIVKVLARIISRSARIISRSAGIISRSARITSRSARIISIIIYAPFIDIPMFIVKYLAMHKVQTHAGVLSKLLYGFAFVRAIIYSLKLADYIPVQTHKPYNNSH